MGVLVLKVYSGRDTATLQSMFERVGPKHAIVNGISNFLVGLCSGSEKAQDSSTPPGVNISIEGNKVQASGTVIFSDHATANDTFLINGVTFTAKASGAGANEFNVGTTAAASATNLAAAINASVTALVLGQVTASVASGTVTITSRFYGVAGNATTIAKGVDSGSVMTVSGARLVNGAEDTHAQTLQF